MTAEEILKDPKQLSGELRLKILGLYHQANAGHIGCSLSCIDLMIADHKVFESELIFCKSIAIKLGFKKNVVDYLSEIAGSLGREDLKKAVLKDYMLT